MTTAINLMPYDVKLIDSLGVFISFPSSGVTACGGERAEALNTLIINGIPVDVTGISPEKSVNIPAPVDDTYYIVSLTAAQAAAAAGRQTSDLLIPAHPVQDGNGCTIGYKEFAVI